MQEPDQDIRSNSRTVGAVYLLYFLTAVAGAVLIRGMVVPGDAAATAHNLMTREAVYRLSFAAGLISNAMYLALTGLLYLLFRPVNRTLSLLAAIFSLVGCVIQIGGMVFQLAPYVIYAGGSSSLPAFSVGQRQALALMVLKGPALAFNVGVIFFALFCLLLGCLIWSSTFLPRFLGVLMVAAGAGWLCYLAEPLPGRVAGVVQSLGFLAELLFMFWLLLGGVDEARWRTLAEGVQSRT